MSLLHEPHVTRESPKYQQLKRQVEQTLSDRKIAALVMASLRFDDDFRKGLIPESHSDSSIDKAVFEEIIQVALREYLSEDNVNSDLDFGKGKPADENGLGPFTKCVFSAILKKAYSSIAS
jgi:hypothetical protein